MIRSSKVAQRIAQLAEFDRCHHIYTVGTCECTICGLVLCEDDMWACTKNRKTCDKYFWWKVFH